MKQYLPNYIEYEDSTHYMWSPNRIPHVKIDRLREIKTGKIVCSVMGCGRYTDEMLTPDPMRPGSKLCKPYCDVHSYTHDWEPRGSDPWTYNRRRQGLWCRMSLLAPIYGLNPEDYQSLFTKDYYEKLLKTIKKLIDIGAIEDAKSKAENHDSKFMNEHVGQKDFGKMYTVTVDHNNGNAKTRALEDYRTNLQKRLTNNPLGYINGITDSYMKNELEVYDWNINEAIVEYKERVNEGKY